MSSATRNAEFGPGCEQEVLGKSASISPAFRNILVAVDGDELRAGTVHAALLVSGPSSRISVLHVGTSPIDTVLAAEPPEKPCDISDENDPVLSDACSRISSELLARRIYCEGNVERQIIEVSDETEADLLVIGTHARSMAGRLLLGSTAIYVLRHAACPVLVASRMQGDTPPPGRDAEIRILVPIDSDGGPSPAAADVASRIAADRNARIALVHVVAPAPEFVPEYGIMVEGSIRPYLNQQANQFLQSFLIRTPNGSAVHRILREGEAASEILSAAAEWKPDLIVMGTHGRHGIGRLVLGSVAEKVACHSRCPVLCVPSHGRKSRGTHPA